MNHAKLGFELRKIQLPLEAILPLRQVGGPQRKIARFKTILSSIKEIGLVEPLVVYPQKGASGKYLLLDGHLRLAALRELAQESAECIISTDDECYTYNARVSRVNPIQEHRMITKAVQNGVSPERIAAALNVPIRQVRATLTLLEGIHAAAADLLKDKGICPKAVRMLKRVASVRQIEIAELMVSTNNFAAGYAEALVLATPKDQMANPAEPKKKAGLTAESIARMEAEMESLERDIKAVEDSYGENILNLTLARGYVRRLLDNAKVVRYLTTNHPELLSEFETIAAVEGL